jgi:hypothetical protein
MDNTIADVLLGIITGILTTGLLFIAKTLWDTKLKPILEEIRYKGVKVDGKWGARSEDAEKKTTSEITLFLEQSAYSLEGICYVKVTSPQNSFNLANKTQGKIWEGYVVLSFTPLDRRVTSIATALFKIGGGGINLVGQYAFRNVNDENVSSVPLTLMRDVKVA